MEIYWKNESRSSHAKNGVSDEWVGKNLFWKRPDEGIFYILTATADASIVYWKKYRNGMIKEYWSSCNWGILFYHYHRWHSINSFLFHDHQTLLRHESCYLPLTPVLRSDKWQRASRNLRIVASRWVLLSQLGHFSSCREGNTRSLIKLEVLSKAVNVL